jgi:hypothetical protein
VENREQVLSTTKRRAGSIPPGAQLPTEPHNHQPDAAMKKHTTYLPLINLATGAKFVFAGIYTQATDGKIILPCGSECIENKSFGK